MFSRKNCLLLILLIFLPGFLSAQEVLFRARQGVRYDIPYREDDGSRDHAGNEILKEMARDVLREPWLVKIRVSGMVGLAILRDGNRAQLRITLDRTVIGGDTAYRRFSVSGVLAPAGISLKLRWANRADTSGFTEEDFINPSLPRGDSVIGTVPVASFVPEVDTLLVRDVSFFYDSLALGSFLDRISLIHDYYASVALLDSLRDYTADMHLDEPSLLPVNYFRVEELGRVVERIRARDFPGTLLRDGYDPSGLMKKYTEMFRRSRTLIYTFLDEMHKTGAIPWDGGAGRLADLVTSRVHSYIRRSFLMDQQQGRIYNDCLDHLYDHGVFPPEENAAGRMLAKMFPGAREDTVDRYLSERIYDSYRALARRLTEQNRFAEAYSLLENGRRFLEENPYMKGVRADDSLQSQAAEGIYNSYVGIAASCLDVHKPEMAGKYLSKAREYGETHQGRIRSDSAYRIVFSRLFFMRNADCDQLLDRKQFAEALDCYRQFEKVYSLQELAMVSGQMEEKMAEAREGLSSLSVSLSRNALKRGEKDSALVYFQKSRQLDRENRRKERVVNHDSLARIMAQLRFESLADLGNAALGKRQYTLSFTRFREARSLADSLGMDPGRKFDSLYRQSMKNLLIVQLYASRKLIWINRFDSAEAVLRKTGVAGFNYGLTGEPDFREAMENFRQKITEQHCRNLHDSAELRMIRAGRAIALQNFRSAVDNADQALAFARSMPVCRIEEKPMAEIRETYREAARYQQELAAASSLVATGSYDSAVRVIDRCRRSFGAGGLNRFGLQPVDICGYILEKNNPYFTEKAIMFFMNGGDQAMALRLLLIGNDQGMQQGSGTALQKQLGRHLAEADFRKAGGEVPGGNSLKDIPTGRWLDPLRTSYDGEWKRLVKENAGKK